MNHFHGSTVFSKMDLRHGYLQVKLAEESRVLTVLTWGYSGIRLLSGCRQHPADQKIMSLILAGIPGVSIYLEDVVVHGSSTALHDIGSSNTTSHSKCTFNAKEASGSHEMASCPIMSDVDAILSLPEPQTPFQLSSYLGIATYYPHVMPQCTVTTAPLRQLLKKDST